MAKSVTGVDRNPRALEFSRANSALNGQDGMLELLPGDLYEPVAGRRFDLILVNPPFELKPEGAAWFAHSDGGEDGLDVIRRILPATEGHLSPGGRFEMITWSPASPRGPALTPLLIEAFPGARITLDYVQELPLEPEVRHFEDSAGYADWRSRLQKRGLDRILLIFARVDTAAAAGIEIRNPEAEIAACESICDGWGQA